jgi:hypothetical protein
LARARIEAPGTPPRTRIVSVHFDRPCVRVVLGVSAHADAQ